MFEVFSSGDLTDLFLGPGIAELVNVSGTFMLPIAFYF